MNDLSNFAMIGTTLDLLEILMLSMQDRYEYDIVEEHGFHIKYSI